MSYWLPFTAFVIVPQLVKRGVALRVLTPLRASEARELVRCSLWWTYFAAPVGAGMVLLCNLLLLEVFAPQNVQHQLHQAPPLFWNFAIWSPYLLLCLGYDLFAARRIPQSEVGRRSAQLWAWITNGLWMVGFIVIVRLMFIIDFLEA